MLILRVWIDLKWLIGSGVNSHLVIYRAFHMSRPYPKVYAKALASRRPSVTERYALALAYPKVYTARVLTPCRPLGNPLGLVL